MSNPLLRPNDPRFQKPKMRDAGGKNPFGEGEQKPPPEAVNDVYSTGVDEARPFVPKYEVQHHSRPQTLLIMAGLGWAAALIGAQSLVTGFQVGWISPLIGLVPAGAAFFLGHEELRAIAVGAIAAEARERSSYAYWLGLTGLVACGAVVAAMIYRQMNFLPEI